MELIVSVASGVIAITSVVISVITYRLRLETLYHKKVVNVDGSIFLRKSPPFHIDKGNLGRTFYFLRKVS